MIFLFKILMQLCISAVFYDIRIYCLIKVSLPFILYKYFPKFIIIPLFGFLYFILLSFWNLMFLCCNVGLNSFILRCITVMPRPLINKLWIFHKYLDLCIYLQLTSCSFALFWSLLKLMTYSFDFDDQHSKFYLWYSIYSHFFCKKFQKNVAYFCFHICFKIITPVFFLNKYLMESH